MRMIDADKAVEATWEQPTYTDPLNVLTEVRERIRELPTVDAIPVSWIKENKSLANKVGAWQYELFLDTLLKDWEEERKEG